MQIVERRISFNGGEISPWTDPRLDLEKYRTSCRTLENMRPTLYGGAFSRAGTVFLAEQDSPEAIGRVVPFEFSATTNLVLVFTDELMRPYTTGASPAVPQVTSAEAAVWTGPGTVFAVGDFVRVLPAGTIYYCLVAHTSTDFATDLAAVKWEATTDFKLPTPYAAAEVAELQFTQINDQIYISHPSHAPRVLSRHGNAEWTLEELELEYPPLRDENITTNALTSDDVTGSVIITSNLDIFDAGHVGSRWVIKHRREQPSVKLLLSAAVNDTSTALMVLGEWSCAIVAGQGTTSWTAEAVVERSTDKSTWETIRNLDASRQDQSSLITGTEIEPAWLRVKLLAKTGSGIPSAGAFTLEAVDPDHHGIVEITSWVAADEVTATVIFELGGTGSTTRYAEAAWSDYRGWPRAVCIHEQRLLFGGNASQPQTLWGSVIDDFGNYLTGGNDDMALIFTMANQRANAIQWLLSQEALLVGTAGAEGPLGSRETDKTITPTNAKLGRFTQTGSAYIQAVPAQDAVIFVNRSGRKLWEMAFAFESDGYKANDLTLLAEHIADDAITGITLQKNPETVLWCVTAGGTLLGLAYDRGQNVAGWFRYVTAGAFESVAVVSGDGEEDEIWVTVRRTIDGNTVRYLERFQPDRLRLLKDGDAASVCCADAAVIYDGAAATTITGLDHLEGETVAVLADGYPLATHTVTGGEIELAAAASVVIAGLPFTATLAPTYLETGDPGSVSKVAWKNVAKVVVELWESLGCEVSADGGTTWEALQFADQGALMDTALPLFSGVKECRPPSSSERQKGIRVRQTQPLPLNVLSLHIYHEMNATP